MGNLTGSVACRRVRRRKLHAIGKAQKDEKLYMRMKAKLLEGQSQARYNIVSGVRKFYPPVLRQQT